MKQKINEPRRGIWITAKAYTPTASEKEDEGTLKGHMYQWKGNFIVSLFVQLIPVDEGGRADGGTGTIIKE